MEVGGLYGVRSRFGWVFGQVLLYGTAGLAIAPWDTSAVSAATAMQLGGVSSTNYGVAAGVGIEYKLALQLGLRAELMHYGLPGLDLVVPGIGTASEHFESAAGRVGIIWSFN
jgi:opacity protein-like surface antigen